MAEGVISVFLEKVIDFAQNEISKVVGAKRELDKLEQELRSIQPILRAAHTKLFTSKEVKKEVKGWILRLNEVAYDGLDLIDLYRIQHRSNTNETHSRHSKVRQFFYSPFKMGKEVHLLGKIGSKIKDISDRLSVLYKEKDLYGLLPLGEGSSSAHKMSEIWERRQTTANITESKLVGREKDEEVVAQWFLEEQQEIEGSVCVVAIVGMGGVGKTTLAKQIYNRFSETKIFDKCMWVCVSNSPNLFDLFRKILEEVDENERGSTSQLIGSNALSSRIRKQLKEKKFLLVLDDVWDYEWWKETTGLWRGGRSGSKVLITTRNVTVANAIKSNHLLELKGLKYEQSWQLFINEALRNGEAEKELDGVRDVGEGIVRRCGGLPLALSTVGGVMRLKERSRSVWQDVLNSPFWSWECPQSQNEDENSIFCAIALSYMNISFPLKQCLTYCCIFPKDFEMEKENLLRLWMAEGFIRKEQGIDLEVSAERHLEALVSCNLIQVNEYIHEIPIEKRKVYKLHSTIIPDDGHKVYTLHDIVHDFAFYIRGEEHVSVDQLKRRTVPAYERICSSVGVECSLEGLSEQKLRALVLHDIRSLTCTNFSTFKWLRVLNLCFGDFLELPESIGDLVLLRYLDLSCTYISKLPKSIIKLHDLEIMILKRTGVKSLPDKLSSFCSMRHLDLKLTALKYLPKEIGKLTGLRTLGSFIVGSNEMDGRGSSLRELHDLNNLNGYLNIEHLERVESEEESQYAQLQKKENLKRVELSCGSEDARGQLSYDWDDIGEFDKEFSRRMENVYDALQPPTNISWIGITEYPGVRLPSWMQYRAVPFCCLERIQLRDCKFLECLPNFRHLPNLKTLDIDRFPRLQCLEEWRFDEARKEIIPRFQCLYISNCPMLKTLPFFPTLEKLDLFRLSSFEGWPMENGPREWPCLKRLFIRNCPKLKTLPFSPSLEGLGLVEVFDFEGLPTENGPREWPCLKWLIIKNCPMLKTLPSSPTLEKLHLDEVSRFEGWPMENGPREWPCLKELYIENCPMLKTLPFSPSLEELHLDEVSSFEGWPIENGPREWRCLKRLSIKNCPMLKTLPFSPAIEDRGL